MKKIIYFLLIFTISSCVKESKTYKRQYSIKNESNQNVKLKFYLAHNNEIVTNVVLNHLDSYLGTELEFSNPLSNDDNYYVNSTYKGSDSIEIIYNNQRKSIFIIEVDATFSEPINRNIFRHGNYTDLGNDFYEFIITDEDYNNAEDCNGDCE